MLCCAALRSIRPSNKEHDRVYIDTLTRLTTPKRRHGPVIQPSISRRKVHVGPRCISAYSVHMFRDPSTYALLRHLAAFEDGCNRPRTPSIITEWPSRFTAIRKKGWWRVVQPSLRLAVSPQRCHRFGARGLANVAMRSSQKLRNCELALDVIIKPTAMKPKA